MGLFSTKYLEKIESLTLGNGGEGYGSAQPLELVQKNDCGIALTATGQELSNECYVAGFLKSADGVYKKVGATAFLWTDSNVTDGYASWNTHETYWSGGATHDEYSLACWAKHGAAFFPTGIGSAFAPGDHILKIYGSMNIDYDIVPDIVGYGMDFMRNDSHAAGMTSQKFHDYEEGTWTPKLVDASNNESESQTYNAATYGRYTKIGRTVFINGYLFMSSLGTLTGGDRANITGLPFNCVASKNYPVHFGFGNGLDITAGTTIAGYVNQNSAKIALTKWDSILGTNEMLIEDITADGELVFSGFYEVE